MADGMPGGPAVTGQVPGDASPAALAGTALDAEAERTAVAERATAAQDRAAGASGSRLPGVGSPPTTMRLSDDARRVFTLGGGR